MKKLIYFLVCLLIAINFASAQDLPEGLIAYYPFDGNANNQASEFGHGTVVGAVLTEDRNGNPNSAYLFNGVDSQYIDISDDLVLPLGNEPRTLAAWVRCDDFNLDDGHIMAYGNQTDGQHCHLSFHMFDGFVRMGFWYNDIDAYADIFDEIWYHIAAVWDGDKVSIYVDGDLKASVAPSYEVNTVDHETIHLRIGCQNSESLDNKFPGVIDEVMIFSRALDGSEIASIMDINPTKIDNENDMQASSFELYQNYPNPFNPSTKISYRLAHSSAVSIEIFDLSGKQVRKLIYKQQPSGIHTLSFDATGLASGLYIYQLKAGSFKQSRKMLVLQ